MKKATSKTSAAAKTPVTAKTPVEAIIPVAPANPEPQIRNEPAVRILKVGTCPSLSGKSTLTYHVGCNAESEILFRVYANSSSGYFSNEWIAMKSIQQVSSKIPLDKPITSYLLLDPVYVGRSQNSPGFLLAVLKNEGLVVPAEGNERCYLRIDPSKFMAEVKKLIESGVDLKDGDKPKNEPAGKKAAPVKNAAPGKKAAPVKQVAPVKKEVTPKKAASKAGSKKTPSPKPA